MRAKLTTVVIATALAWMAMPGTAQADKTSADESKAKINPETSDDGVEKPSQPTAAEQEPAPGNLPKDASAALVRASAAYEYGDMNQVVESARPVAEGLLPATREEQIQAFRLLGIGLFLTNRPLGAETAFTELLRKEPRARLDPTTTRPELVAFFESLRHQQLAKQRSTRKMFWNFIPPVGQFQNDDNVKGWLVLSVGVLSFGTALTTSVLLSSWEKDGHQYPGHEDAAGPMKAINWASVGLLAATYLYGVFDGIVGYGKPIDENKSSAWLHFSPAPGGLRFTF